MGAGIGIVLLVCVGKVGTEAGQEGVKRWTKHKRVALPVFEINGRTVVEFEVWVAEDGLPVADAVLAER